MRVEVNISKEVLDWVMAHIHPDELPINTVTTLQQWRSGEKTPTFNQIEQISKAVSMPLGYFFLSTPPAEDISFTEYRTVDSMLLNNPSRNLIDTVNDMELTQEWVRDHILSIGGTPNTFGRRYKSDRFCYTLCGFCAKDSRHRHCVVSEC